MSTLIVFCIIAIIAFIAFIGYNTLSKAECSQDTDCKPSYKCQSGKCTSVTPVNPGGVTPCTSADCILCNSDNCPLPNTCKNNQCVSPCSLTNCSSPNVCNENNECTLPPLCTSDQFAKLFPYVNPYCMGDPVAGPCTSTADRKYLSFDKTGIALPFELTDPDPVSGSITYESIYHLSAEECKNKCDLNPKCTIVHYDPSNGGFSRGCQLITQPIGPLFQKLHAMQDQEGCVGFYYSPTPDLFGNIIMPTYVKVSALA